jgi:hypothetical protein
MKALSVLLFGLFLSVSQVSHAEAKAKLKCKKGFSEVSCEGVNKAKRKYFCWKGNPAKGKKEMICSKKMRKAKSKKKA